MSYHLLDDRLSISGDNHKWIVCLFVFFNGYFEFPGASSSLVISPATEENVVSREEVLFLAWWNGTSADLSSSCGDVSLFHTSPPTGHHSGHVFGCSPQMMQFFCHSGMEIRRKNFCVWKPAITAACKVVYSTAVVVIAPMFGSFFCIRNIHPRINWLILQKCGIIYYIYYIYYIFIFLVNSKI